MAPIAYNNVLGSLRALGCPDPRLRRVKAADKEEPLRTDQNFLLLMAPFPPLATNEDPQPKETDQAKTKDGQTGRVWNAEKLSTAIKMIPGVLDVGLFVGFNGLEALKRSGGKRLQDPIVGQAGQKPVAMYFGMQDGSVKERKAPDSS